MSDVVQGQKLLDWINGLLKSEYEKIEHLGNGAAYCQMFDMIYPQAKMPMHDIYFSTTIPRECRQNFKLLCKAFRKMHIRKMIPLTELVDGTAINNLSFLIWFKDFFDQHYTGRKYDVVAERNGCRMGYIPVEEVEKLAQQQVLPQVAQVIPTTQQPLPISINALCAKLTTKLTISDNNEPTVSETRAQQNAELTKKGQSIQNDLNKLAQHRDVCIKKLRNVEMLCDQYNKPSDTFKLMDSIIATLADFVRDEHPIARKTFK